MTTENSQKSNMQGLGERGPSPRISGKSQREGCALGWRRDRAFRAELAQTGGEEVALQLGESGPHIAGVPYEWRFADQRSIPMIGSAGPFRSGKSDNQVDGHRTGRGR